MAASNIKWKECLPRQWQRLQDMADGGLANAQIGKRDHLAVAEKAVDGQVGFSMKETYFTPVGRQNIDWSGSHHAHQEWRAQLNRFFFLPSLAFAWTRTGTARYAEAAKDYLRDWLDAHPVRPLWSLAEHDNTLNLAIRLQMWWYAIPELSSSTIFDESFLQELADSTAAQLAFLRNNLNEGGNWRIAQAESFLLCGLVLNELTVAGDWRGFGVRLLNEAFLEQFLSDGVHIERNPGYHSWMTNVFHRYWLIGRACPELGLRISEEGLERMYSYLLATKRPNGSMCGINDCTGTSGGNRAEEWDAEYRRFRQDAGQSTDRPPLSSVFPDAGQIFWRSGWGEEDTYITFDASTWGGAHCHLARNSLQVYAYGRSLLTDPGVIDYEVSNPLMAYGKSTRAHNTVNFNGLNQSPADPKPLQYASQPGYEFAASRYQGGYWPGELHWWFANGHGQGLWGEHHRAVLWVRGRCLFVIDSVLHGHEQTPPVLECNWQLAQGEVRIDAPAWSARTCHEDANLALFFPVRPENAILSVHEGEMNPTRGWLPGGTPAPMLSLAAEQQDWNCDLVTVLVPFAGTGCPLLRACGSTPEGGKAGRVELVWADGSTDILLWTRQQEHRIGPYGQGDTDAALLHQCHSADGEFISLFALDATFAAPYCEEVKPAPSTFSCLR